MKIIPITLLTLVFLTQSGIVPIHAQEVYPDINDETGKWGLKNFDDELVVDYIYDEIYDPNEFGVARVTKDNNYAYVNEKGTLLTPWLDEAPEYLEIRNRIMTDGKYNIIYESGNIQFKEWYDYIYSYQDYTIPDIILNQEGYWQFTKANGKLNKQKWEETYGWNEDFEIMVQDGGEWLCWDAFEGEQAEKGFMDVYHYSDGMSVQERYGLYGYIDEEGNLVIPFQFAGARSFHEGYAAVMDTSGKAGFINKAGELVIDYSFSEVGNFENGLSMVMKYADKPETVYTYETLYTYIDNTGQPITEEWYDDIGEFSEGLAWVEKKPIYSNWYESKYGFLNTEGKEVIPFELDAAHDFSSGYAAVAKLQGKDSIGDPVFKMGFIDKTGKLVIDYQYDYGNRPGYSTNPEAYQFSEGLASVGKLTSLKYSSIPVPEYTDVNIREIGKPQFIFGYINEKGELVVDYEYDYAGKFENGIARVKKGEDEFCIDMNGKTTICPPRQNP